MHNMPIHTGCCESPTWLLTATTTGAGLTATLGIAHLQRHARRLAVENQELTQRLHALRHVARSTALASNKAVSETSDWASIVETLTAAVTESQAAAAKQHDMYNTLQQHMATLQAEHAVLQQQHAELTSAHAALKAQHVVQDGRVLQGDNGKHDNAQWLKVETEVRCLHEVARGGESHTMWPD